MGMEEAYEDLFNFNRNAQNMSNDDVKNKLKTLTQDQKSDRVIEQMAMTFRSLCSYADWSIHEEQRIDTNNIICLTQLRFFIESGFTGSILRKDETPCINQSQNPE